RFVILQYRIVAAGYQVIGSKGFEGADERCLGAVTDGVVIEFLRGDARRFGDIGVPARALTLLVEAVHQHRDRPAEVRGDGFAVWISVRDLLRDHVQYESRVFE